MPALIALGRWAPIGALCLLAACSQKQGTEGGLPVEFTFEPAEQLDLLFMVDNSSAPTGQMEFRQNLAPLMAELAGLPGGVPDLHAGVVTSDLGAGRLMDASVCGRPGGDRGVLRVRGDCGLPAGQSYVTAARGAQSLPVEQLACLMNVGAAGCGYEHQLASVARALDSAATPENAGFLRSSAHLAIVIMTDEDDCSAPPDSDFFTGEMPNLPADTRCALAAHACNGMHPPAAEFSAPMSTCKAADDGPLIPVQTLVDRIRASKAAPDQQLTVAAVYGVPGAHPEVDYKLTRLPSGQLLFASRCQSGAGEAILGLRMARFVEGFGPAGASFDVCPNDFASTMTNIGRTLARRLSTTCAPAPVRDCDVSVAGSKLPFCGASLSGPCWTLNPDPRCAASGYAFTIDRAATLPAGRITARCYPL